VLIGDDLSASTFWHGAKMDAWANAWVSYYTQQGNFAVTGMEDTGTLQSLKFLAQAELIGTGFLFCARSATMTSSQKI